MYRLVFQKTIRQQIYELYEQLEDKHIHIHHIT